MEYGPATRSDWVDVFVLTWKVLHVTLMENKAGHVMSDAKRWHFWESVNRFVGCPSPEGRMPGYSPAC